jgi:hypothetical protein
MADDVGFTISLTGETTKEKWFGEFRARKRLSFKQQMVRDRIRRELLGEYAQFASQRTQEVAVMFSDLAVGLTESPNWWKSSEGGQLLHDDNVLDAVWTEVAKIWGVIKEDDQKKVKTAAETLKTAVNEKDAEKEELAAEDED